MSFTNKYLRVCVVSTSLVISAKLTISNLEDKPIYRSFSRFDHLRVELESKIKWFVVVITCSLPRATIDLRSV